MLHRTFLSAVVVLGVLGGTVDARADPADRRGFEIGPAAEFMWGPFSTLDGPWFAAGAAVDARFASPFHLRGKLLLAIGRVSLETGAGDEADSASMVEGGLILRVLPSVDLGPYVVFRLGPAVAALVGDYSSSRCGDESYKDIALGASTELAFRFGKDSAFELGGQLDIIPVTPPRCGLKYPTSSDPALMDQLANEPEDNVGLFLGATFSFLLLK
jgi:hypothetical protein